MRNHKRAKSIVRFSERLGSIPLASSHDVAYFRGENLFIKFLQSIL